MGVAARRAAVTMSPAASRQFATSRQFGGLGHRDDRGRNAAECDNKISHPAALGICHHGGVYHRDGLRPAQTQLHEHAQPVHTVGGIEPDCGDDLVGFEDGLAEAGEELGDGDRALAPC